MFNFWVANAFTSDEQVLTGNPAGVCVVDVFPSDDEMQRFAAQVSLSETAFVVPRGPLGHFDIRWFSPLDEAPLCGHATLAAAHILLEQGFIKGENLSFFSRQRRIWVQSRKLPRRGFVFGFPAYDLEQVSPPPTLVEALGTEEIEQVFFGENVFVVVLSSFEVLQDLEPDLLLLSTLPGRAVTITAQGPEDFDYATRYFAPKIGIPEDPVCGSSHTRLGPLWAKRLQRNRLAAYHPAGMGYIEVGVLEEGVSLGGTAETIFSSQVGLPVFSKAKILMPSDMVTQEWGKVLPFRTHA